MALLQCEPGQILRPLDTPESQPIKAIDEVDKTRFHGGGEPSPRHAFRLVDDAGAVAEQEHVALAGSARHLERVKQGKPFGVPA